MATYRIRGRDWEARGLLRAERKGLEARGLSMIAGDTERAGELLDAVLALLWPSTEAQETLDQADQADIDTLYADVFKQTYPVEAGKGIVPIPKAQWPVLSTPVRGLRRCEEKALRAANAEFLKGLRADGIANVDAVADATLAVVFPDPADQAVLDRSPNAACLSLFAEIRERSKGKGGAVKN
jgi:hypothetical protein